jgi:sugar phosphate isomerase/epimerase
MNGALDGIGWVLWAGTIGFDSPMDKRIEAARAAGCSRVSVAAPDVARSEQAGTSAEELGRRIRDAGLDVGMDPIMNWHGSPALPGPFGEFGMDEELRICEALQVAWMTAIGPFRPQDLEHDRLAERFAAVCDRAAGFGAQVQYEFMPISAVTDVTTAATIVEAADRPNGGIVFDTWHFFRGTPDYTALERVPGDRIFSVQLSDAAAEVRGTLSEDTMNRLLPGDGSFDLTRALAVLDRKGALRWVGPEVISPALEAMDSSEAARLAVGRVRDVVAEVRSADLDRLRFAD